MKRISAALVILLGLASAALAQTVRGPIPNSGVYGAYNAAPPTCIDGSGCWFQTDINGNLKVTGSFSSTISGFTPGLTYATLTASGSSASVALPAGVVVAFQNTGTTTVSCTLGVGSATATAGMIQVPPSSTIFLTVGANTFGACIDESGSVSNVVRLAGGAGLGTGFGGGGGSGGSSSITTWAGGTLGAMATYGTSPGAVNVPGVNAFVTNTNANGQAALAASSPVAVAKNSGTGSTIAGAAIGTAGTASAEVVTVQGIAAGTPLIVGPNPYPVTAVPYTASATGTTGATTATLTGAASVTTYICGFSIRANATAAATGNATVTGTITGTLNYTQWTAPLASGIGVVEQIFSPCVPASAANTSIAVVSAAPGAGGVVSVSAWGYKL